MPSVDSTPRSRSYSSAAAPCRHRLPVTSTGRSHRRSVARTWSNCSTHHQPRNWPAYHRPRPSPWQPPPRRRSSRSPCTPHPARDRTTSEPSVTPISWSRCSTMHGAFVTWPLNWWRSRRAGPMSASNRTTPPRREFPSSSVVGNSADSMPRGPPPKPSGHGPIGSRDGWPWTRPSANCERWRSGMN